MKNTSEYYYIYDILTDSHCRSVKLEKKKKNCQVYSTFFLQLILLYSLCPSKERDPPVVREKMKLCNVVFSNTECLENTAVSLTL